MSTTRVQLSDGDRIIASSVEEALTLLRNRYADAVCYQNGNEITNNSDVDTHGPILVWRDEEDSHNDDGAKAIAELRVES